MRVWRGAFFVFLFLSACSSGGQTINPPVTHPVGPPAGGNGGGSSSPTPSPTPSPTATPTPTAQIHITETSVATEPLYVAQGPDGAAYFGFGANGTGSNLYRYSSGAFVQTQPAAPPNGYSPGGGVYGITAASNGSIYWLSAYFGDGAQFMPFVMVQCGGSGGDASLCEPNVDEPTSMVVDASGVFWVGGITSSGGGQIATGSGATFDSSDEGVLQLIDGPGNAVWGILLSSSQTYSIARFAVTASTVSIAQQYALAPTSSAGSMTMGRDGNLWFTDFAAGKIGRLTPNGTITEFQSPHAIDGPQYGEVQASTDCDGNVWYSESSYGAVVRTDMTGHTTEYLMPTGNAYPAPVAANVRGPNCRRTIWIGEARADRLALVTY